MRLTLRTLLAYLDDMLEPAETRRIGQKVAESEAAQELVARIKQVTRRRRLTTPPLTGPGSFDPNTVAEYLDNALSADEVADVERQALESDVHLAEIASVHQILTLVLGQPVLIPPTARQRMYGLVRGREAKRPRRARALPPRETVGDGAARREAAVRDEEESPLGLVPAVAGGGVARWLLPAAAGFLLALVLGGILYGLWLRDSGPHVAQASAAAGAGPAAPAPGAGEGGGAGTKPADAGRAAVPGPGPITPPDRPPGSEAAPETPVKPPAAPEVPAAPAAPQPEVRPEPPRPGPLAAPDGTRRELGRYTDAPQPVGFLVRRAAAGEPWQRLAPNSRVASRDMMLSLPGFRSDVTLESGVLVSLVGQVPESANAPVLEAALVLHVPPDGYDADLTFDRGALRIRAPRASAERPARVRVRFLDQAWDLALEDPATDVGLLLISRQGAPYPAHQPPRAECFLFLLKGQASVGLAHETHHGLRPTTDPLVLSWDNQTRTVRGPAPAVSRIDALLLPIWSDNPPANELARNVRLALNELNRRVVANRPVEAGLVEFLQPGEASTVYQRMLAVRSLTALDSLADVVNVLGDERQPPEVREDAIFTLRIWLGRGSDLDQLLYDPQKRTGILIDRKYTPREAETILTLLYPFAEAQRGQPETYATLIDLLRHDRLAIRQLAYWHLVRLDPAGRDIPYNAAWPPEQLERAYQAWKRHIPDGSSPGRAAPPGPGS